MLSSKVMVLTTDAEVINELSNNVVHALCSINFFSICISYEISINNYLTNKAISMPMFYAVDLQGFYLLFYKLP